MRVMLYVQKHHEQKQHIAHLLDSFCDNLNATDYHIEYVHIRKLQ